MRWLLAPLSLLLAFHANAFSQLGQDITDLWWNPAESGWGMNVIQQGDTSFLTMFVYGSNNQPTWFVASDLKYAGWDATNHEGVHEGDLYQTTGPAFSAGTFNPGAVTLRKVGTLQFRAGVSSMTNTIYVGRVTYTVDGVPVTKLNLERQMWRIVSHAGTYSGAFRFTVDGCTNPASNGEYVLYGVTSVTKSADDILSISVVNDGGTFSCTYAGRYYQAGRNGVIPSGSFSCSDGAQGDFLGVDINSGTTGMSGNLATIYSSGGCHESVRFSAAR